MSTGEWRQYIHEVSSFHQLRLFLPSIAPSPRTPTPHSAWPIPPNTLPREFIPIIVILAHKVCMSASIRAFADLGSDIAHEATRRAAFIAAILAVEFCARVLLTEISCEWNRGERSEGSKGSKEYGEWG